MPDPVSRIGVGSVAAVFDMRDAVLCEVFLDLLPRGLQQWADQPASDRRDPGESTRPCAAAKIHQHSLCIVVEIMCRGDPITVQPVSRLLQEAISQRSGRILCSEALLLGICRDISVAHGAGDAEPAALLGCKLCITARFFPSQSVFKVRREEREAVRFPQFIQPVKQAHAVRTAGHRTEDSAPLRQHCITLDQVILHRSGVPRRRRRYTPAAS